MTWYYFVDTTILIPILLTAKNLPQDTESTEAAKRGINTKAFPPFFSVSSVLSVVKNFERELLNRSKEMLGVTTYETNFSRFRRSNFNRAISAGRLKRCVRVKCCPASVAAGGLVYFGLGNRQFLSSAESRSAMLFAGFSFFLPGILGIVRLRLMQRESEQLLGKAITIKYLFEELSTEASSLPQPTR